MIRRPAAVRGFTLIELLMSLALVTILLSISLPSMGTLLSSTQARTSKQDLFVALSAARATAVQGRSATMVCPSADGSACTGGLRWDGGWIAFTDGNGNGERDGSEELIGQSGPLQRNVVITSTAGRDRIGFRGDGSATGNNVTFTLCDKRGAGAASSIVVNNPGRIRSGQATADAAAATCALLAPRA